MAIAIVFDDNFFFLSNFYCLQNNNKKNYMNHIYIENQKYDLFCPNGSECGPN